MNHTSPSMPPVVPGLLDTINELRDRLATHAGVISELENMLGPLLCPDDGEDRSPAPPSHVPRPACSPVQQAVRDCADQVGVYSARLLRLQAAIRL